MSVRATKKFERSLGVKVSAKSPRDKRPTLPGQHGGVVVRRRTVYSRQRRAMQVVKSYYALTEKQMRRYYLDASKKRSDTSVYIVQGLEARITTVLYRAGIACTMFSARQIVSHGHVTLNGKRVTIPSIRLRVGDKIELSKAAHNIPAVVHGVSRGRKVPDYLEFDKDNLSVILKALPESIESVPYEIEIQMNLLVEFYSK